MKTLFSVMVITLALRAEGAVLQGKINNVPWTFVSGRAKPSIFRPGYLEFDFWDHEESRPCDSFTWGSDNKILTSMPAKVGKYALGNTQNITFNFPDNHNNISTVGTFVITVINADSVEGTITTKFDAKNFVTGTFSVPYCK